MASIPDNIEVFEHPQDYNLNEYLPEDEEPYESGIYFWYCFPGCIPDGDPIGPFETIESAIEQMGE